MLEKMQIGVIGYGFVGQALTQWLVKNNPGIEIRISDPAKGLDDDISNCDAYFIQIHIPTEKDGTQDLGVLRQIVNRLPADKPIWIRTTVLPGTINCLQAETGRMVWHMPEFLTQRTYIEDFANQTSVFTGDVKLLRRIFPGKPYVVMSSEEAELAKYAHNVFSALKVTYFNCIYDICARHGLDYSNVLKGVMSSGYVNKPHTAVPGPDHMFGYGGKCFPKDVRAAQEKYKNTPFGKLIAPLEKLNESFRNRKVC